MFENKGVKKLTFELVDPSELVKEAIEKTISHLQDGRFVEAELIIAQTLKVDPDNLSALSLYGLVKFNQQKYEEAIEIYEKILSFDPNHVDAHNNIHLCYGAVGDLDKALEHIKKAAELKPECAAYHNNLGMQYAQARLWDESFQSFNNSLQLCEDPNTLVNIGSVYGNLRDIDKAIEFYKKAIFLKPDLANAHVCLAEGYFLKNDFKNAWKEYEWRFKGCPQLQVLASVFNEENRWNGEDLNNKQIFVYAEQGIGDGIQFIRYLKPLKEKYPKCKIILHCLPEVESIYRLNNVADEYISSDLLNKLNHPEYDYHTSLLSLPFILNFSKVEVPYLKTDLQADLSNYRDFYKIGICWAGNPQHPNDKMRSCYLKYFKDIYKIPGVKLFSLQKDLRKRMYRGIKKPVDLTEDCQDIKIVDMSPWMVDMNTTAAIMEKLDLIITVDTSILHLAGAIGAKCWALIPWTVDWRWGLQDESTRWYPTVQLFRQDSQNDWEGLFKKIHENILQIIGK